VQHLVHATVEHKEQEEIQTLASQQQVQSLQQQLQETATRLLQTHDALESTRMQSQELEERCKHSQQQGAAVETQRVAATLRADEAEALLRETTAMLLRVQQEPQPAPAEPNEAEKESPDQSLRQELAHYQTLMLQASAQDEDALKVTVELIAKALEAK
jgi:hypothetical protein